MSVKRVKIYEKSLLEPLLRFATSVDLVFNPNISVSSRHFHDMMFQLAMKYQHKKIQEVYDFNYKLVRERDLTIKNKCTLRFVDESQITFDYTDVFWDDFVKYIKDLNVIIENRRMMQGHDDEFDDEV
jgi:hypothetical protein